MMVRYGMDEASLSSPDPLADSLTFQAPPSSKPRKTPTSRLSLPLPASSPKKQVFELDVGNTLSPQKIRVTVEAEDSDSEDDHANLRPHNMSSPTPAQIPRRVERTTTTRVPLRGLSDSENDNSIRYEVTPKRRRGRPRKSDTPVKRQGASNRAGKRGRNSIGAEVDNAGPDVDGDGLPAGDLRSRSKSVRGIKKATPRKRKANSDLIPSSVVKRGRGRPRSKLREEIRLSDGSDVAEQVQTWTAERKVVDTDIHEELMPEEIDLLATINANLQSPPSPYPALESTSSFASSEDLEEDVVIARFHPGEATPRTTGWSSVMEASQIPSSSNRTQEETSPISGSVKNVALSPQSNGVIEGDDENNGYGKGGFDDDTDDDFDETREIDQFAGGTNDATGDMQEEDFEEELDDDMHHRPEFDTIMESEGFSLISLNSVPSLKKPLNGLLQGEGQDLIARPQNKNILSLHDTVHDNSFSSIAPGILEAATPGRKLKNSHILRFQNARPDDSFSSIPAEILQAATPAPTRKKVGEIPQPERSTVTEESLTRLADRKSPSESPVMPSKKTDVVREDLPSTIPAVPHDNATPRLMRQAPLRPSSTRKSEFIPKPIPRPSQRTPKSSHLETFSKPSKSPSPPAKECTQSASVKAIGTEASISQYTEQSVAQLAEESLIDSQIHSSPPAIAPRKFTHTAHIRQQRQTNPKMTQTPAIIFSSPTLPPPIQPSRQPSERPESSNTNASSPAEKAGRILQDIVIPSSLPRSRSESLASPFKSPATGRRSSSSIYPDTNANRPIPAEQPQTSVPRLDPNGDMLLKHSRRRSWSRPILDEDPFLANGATQRRPSTDKSQSLSLELPSSRRMSVSINATVTPQHESSRTTNSMNQQAESTSLNAVVEKTIPPSSSTEKKTVDVKRTSSTLQEKWAAQRAAVSKQISTASINEVMVLSSDHDDNDDEDEDDDHDGRGDHDDHDRVSGERRETTVEEKDISNEVKEDYEDDESFGLLLETLDASNQEDQLHSETSGNSEKPRRSKISSLWRTNSKRLVYSDELASLSPDHNTKAPLVEEPSPKSVPKNVDLPKSFQANPQTDGDETLDLSGWQIPQKQNFQPKLRSISNTRPDISALLRLSPFGGLPTLFTGGKRQITEGQSSSDVPVSRKSHFKLSQYSSFSDTEKETSSFAPIPQKMDFQPRVYKNDDASSAAPFSQPSTLSRGLFGKWGATKTNLPTPDTSSSSLVGTLTGTSPSKSNKLKAQTFRPVQPEILPSPPSQFSTSKPSASVETKENRNLQNPKPKWIEHRLEAPIPPSPTKSILRSPQRSFDPPPQPSPSKNVVFASSSPQPSSPLTPQLSPTHWTRDHWLLLDSILQSWKPENENQDTADSEPRTSDGLLNSKYGSRNSTRVISRLLGKTINLKDKGVGIGEGGVRAFKNGDQEIREIGNEKMRLEQWHLEAVDEFRGEVPGWDEAVVAKRVFALLVGEERRKRGIIV
ncbi:bc088733-30b5-4934-a8e1-1ad1e7318aaf [Sclerotinia trifoliorum]|uniref:Bc088733-30b5-4934-a8e1-1ad1e7318aaf n=1 Tax=Sclerotinia trifoliorum TaxID=28548 RepID=A0A8H2VWJ2_9HELO|nr:bc088733-30b5-4934-a8e1-1ad1e7318aaf [Sclerotinia trifoliorum]